jgi:hypothetical protein
MTASSASAAAHRSQSADFARLAVPLVVIAAAIVATLWIDRGGFSVADETSGAAPAAQAATR